MSRLVRTVADIGHLAQPQKAAATTTTVVVGNGEVPVEKLS
jgi:hypothetical protein